MLPTRQQLGLVYWSKSSNTSRRQSLGSQLALVVTIRPPWVIAKPRDSSTRRQIFIVLGKIGLRISAGSGERCRTGAPAAGEGGRLCCNTCVSSWAESSRPAVLPGE